VVFLCYAGYVVQREEKPTAPESISRRFRPQNWGEIVGQPTAVKLLTAALEQNLLHQAYIFAGPRGTGKTTAARILARAVNCLQRRGAEPDNSCEICRAQLTGRALDVVEMDAASKRGIDDIRELQEAISIAPTQGRYRTYIIDEAHMLSREAWNALLKTLEEPPPHALFVLATTEGERIPETVQSRCHLIPFAPLSETAILRRLRELAGKLSLSVSAATLRTLARRAQGSMRDAESLLAQFLMLSTSYREKRVLALMGIPAAEQISAFYAALTRRKLSKALAARDALESQGVAPAAILEALLEYAREELLNQNSSLSSQKRARIYLTLLEGFRFARQARDASGALDLVAVTLCAAREKASKQNPPPTSRSEKEQFVAQAEKEEKGKTSHFPHASPPVQALPATKSSSAAENAVPKRSSVVAAASAPTPLPLKQIKERWERVVAVVARENRILASLLRASIPAGFQGNLLTVVTRFSLYRDRLNQAEVRTLVERSFKRVLGLRIPVRWVTLEELRALGMPEPAPQEWKLTASSNAPDPLTEAARILGAEVAETPPAKSTS
jgi:DNA polymerase-3 subunit gamma/tau